MKKYKIIYADPPWRYARSKVQGAAEKHYPTMSIEELCALPVKEIADKDCILFLWATFPQLKEALQLIKAWGFTYKSVAFVWLKQNRKSPTWFYGLGFWTRGNAEICLLATKGHPKRQSNKVHQFIISPVEQHSKKPDITREKILALIRDIREAHKKDSESAPQTTVADELKENLEAVKNFKGSRDEKLVVLYCKQLGINYKNLSDEEFRWLIRILKKSKKMGTPISQRKKR